MREPDLNKMGIGVLAPLELVARLKQCAEASDFTVTQLVLWELENRYGNLPLSKKWKAWIDEQRKKNRTRRESKRNTARCVKRS